MKQTAHNKQKQKKKVNYLPIVAAVVVVAAALALLVPRLLPGEAGTGAGGDTSAAAQLSEDGASFVIDAEALSETASFFTYDADGTTVEFFAVTASDGTVRLALNTCQVCNGSPYAYFVQEGDYFVCQNCGNRFASTQVGLVSGGCNPVPITEDSYSLQDGRILVSTAFLQENAVRFTNWKKF